MAKTARKKTKKKTTKAARRKTNRTKRKVTLAKTAKQVDLKVDDASNELRVQGGRLVVRISPDSHPEIFEVDRLCKTMRKMIDTTGRKRKCRDLCEFLAETEKGLQIILRNYLEDAMRKYLK